MSLKESTFLSWKRNNEYLRIDSSRSVLTCDICIKWKSKLSGSNAFITGSKNLKSSAVNEHAQSKLHKLALRLEEEELARLENRRCHVVQEKPPHDAPIRQAITNMAQLSEEEKHGVKILFDIAYLIALKGRPYSDFSDLIELEKLHGVKFLEPPAYENHMACKLFIHYASNALYEKELKSKIKKANFVTILADGATDAALIEKEVIYIIFVDPDSFKPTLAFLSLQSVASQDAPGITNAITEAFKVCDILEKLQQVVFFESDGTAVNSGVRNGVISLLQRKYGQHIKFFWCLSHRLELAFKDALKKDMEEVETALRDLYGIYQYSGKRLRELRMLHDILKDVYEFENGEVKPSKASGTRWIDHKLRAMKSFIDKRGLYLAHIQNVIADETKKNDKASLEGKRRRIAQGSLLLKCAMYVDILEPARQLSLTTQTTKELNIVKQVECVDRTLIKYKMMSEKVNQDATAAARSLPTVKHVLSVIVEGDEPSYQGVHVLRLPQSKDSLTRLLRDNVKAICECLGERYGSLVDDLEGELESSKETKDADKTAHSIAKVLNSKVWMLATEEGNREHLRIQLDALEKLFDTFGLVHPLNLSNKQELCDQYVMLVQWATSFFNVAAIDLMELWPRLKNLKQNDAKDLFILIELCLTCPYGNAVCESFISYLRVVKTDWRNRLNESNLTDLLRIKVTGPSLRAQYSMKNIVNWQ